MTQTITLEFYRHELPSLSDIEELVGYETGRYNEGNARCLDAVARGLGEDANYSLRPESYRYRIKIAADDAVPGWMMDRLAADFESAEGKDKRVFLEALAEELPDGDELRNMTDEDTANTDEQHVEQDPASWFPGNLEPDDDESSDDMPTLNGEEIDYENSELRHPYIDDFEDGDLWVKASPNPPKPVVILNGRDGKVEVAGYDTDSEDTVDLACPECGERVEMVTEELDTAGVACKGVICGCRETPATFAIRGL